ncbi:hypothetical protein EZH22_14030 [Xanthobacter dioxanivorans]|uniref:Uncharacterized protein n=1 Tax=Xanthobacter dioxanivorans TaxID=2528964 RepID=A0A974PTI7_9HYPH|nr:hypothetical protein [Xanthobacter dioxanivorans]QRG09271.1 hypothetical protein EZH22_14030 [Xanthobacter dioxanivorans]
MRDPLSETPIPAVDGTAPVIPFPSHLARPSNLPRFAEAQVAPRRDETLVEKLNRALADIASIRRPLEGM